MKKRIHIEICTLVLLLCCCLVSGSLFAQFASSTPYQRTYEYQEYDDFKGEWITISKGEYGYNPFGNRVLSRTFLNDEDELLISTEFKNVYDRQGNLLQLDHKSWNFDPHELYYIESFKVEYKNGNQVYSIRKSTYDETEEIIREEFVTYDENDILIKREWITQYDNSLDERTEYYSNACGYPSRTAFVYRYSENNDVVLHDSIHNTLNSFCYEILSTTYNLISGQPVLRYESRWDYEFNDLDLIISGKYYKRDAGQDWVLEREYENEYDAQGRQTYNYSIRYPELIEDRSVTEYDDQGNRISEIYEFFIPENAVWITNYYFEAEYSETNKILHLEDGYGWLPDLQVYQFSQEVDFIYDENDYRIREERQRTEYTNPETGAKIDYNDVVNVTNRCDGVPVINEMIISSEGNIIRQERLLYSYWQNAECEPDGSEFEVVVFPNPASDYLKIYNPTQLGESSIRIVDSMGRTVMEQDQNLGNYISIDLLGFRQGLYILQIESSKGTIRERFSKI